MHGVEGWLQEDLLSREQILRGRKVWSFSCIIIFLRSPKGVRIEESTAYQQLCSVETPGNQSLEEELLWGREEGQEDSLRRSREHSASIPVSLIDLHSAGAKKGWKAFVRPLSSCGAKTTPFNLCLLNWRSNLRKGRARQQQAGEEQGGSPNCSPITSARQLLCLLD